MGNISLKITLYAYFLYMIVGCAANRKTLYFPDRLNPQIVCSNILSAAQPWMGVPYKYGGNDYNGVDCSGFVQSIYIQVFDIQLPRTTNKMFERGSFVRGSNINCGDLLFFKNIRSRGGVDHVGIFIGNNRFIHASTKRGVVISDLNENYYQSNFVAARRYF